MAGSATDLLGLADCKFSGPSICFSTLKKQLYKIVLAIVILLSTVAPSSALSQTLLIVGEEWPPFEFLDRNGKPVGIDVDIATYIFNKLDIEFEIALHPWSRAWRMIETGEADATLSTSRKEKREPFLYYPGEDMWVSEYIFFNNSRSILPAINNFDDVVEGQYQVGIIRDNSYHDSFWSAFPSSEDGSLNPQLQAVTNIDLNFKKLSRNRIDLFLADRTIGLFTVKMLGLNHTIEAGDHTLFSKGYPMPFARKSSYPNIEQVANDFERELITIKQNGVYQKILDRWIK